MLNTRILALFGLLFLTSCGFKPVYSDNSVAGTSSQMRDITISPTSNRITQLVRNSLISQFSDNGEATTPRYVLTLNVSESVSSVLVRRSTDIQRGNLTIRAQYVLRSTSKNKVLNTGRTVSSASYNRVSRAFGTVQPSEFANISAEKDARKRASIAVAEDINRRLAAYFATRFDAPAR